MIRREVLYPDTPGRATLDVSTWSTVTEFNRNSDQESGFRYMPIYEV
jgi:hypothetical protein